MRRPRGRGARRGLGLPVLVAMRRRCGPARGLVPLLALGLLSVVLQQWLGPPANVTACRAYIGPGAGIAVLGSFLAVFAALLAAFNAILTWPLRRLWRFLRGRRAYAAARVPRVVVVGLDGLEPTLVEQYLAQGLLPNLAKLKETGTYQRLGTTCPPLSPVAWSSFATGANPGKHNIFDFLRPSRADHRPAISSVRIGAGRRKLRLGPYLIPLSRPRISGLRRSKPFWTVLGEHGIFSAILRVPITFPPDRFHGVQLAAMCVPDLLGTQGTFLHCVECGAAGLSGDGDVGGRRIVVQRRNGRIRGSLPGPASPIRADGAPLQVRFEVRPGGADRAELRIDGQTVNLRLGAHSDWVRLRFRMLPGFAIHGICRFLLKGLEPFELYCTPLHIDPARPVMPISHPRVFAIYLAKLLGPYATAGLAEDTWALSECVLSEDAFLAQAYAIHEERQRMLFDALRRVRRGVVVCVFDLPDRVQHMFWRFLEPDHPALAGRPNTHPQAIRDMYVRLDELVGKVRARLEPDSALFVMSDHGFKPFCRGVDLNAWLRAGGYLALKDGATSSAAPYLAEVDWARTRAYAIGLAGLYVNQRGRDGGGVVEPGEPTRVLLAELKAGLEGLEDAERGCRAIREAISARSAYRGPYVGEAPDLLVGYRPGYRVAWDAAIGKCSPRVFSANTKAWSGDHCVHPALLPGVLFGSLKLRAEGAHIMDMAPTALELMGVAPPAYMDGRSLLCPQGT